MQAKRFLLWLIILQSFLFMATANGEPISGYSKENGYQYILLGRYPKQADGTVEPVLWRVLATEAGHALLLSEYILFNHRVHEDYQEYEDFEGQFNKTEIYDLLNGTFLQTAFDAKEQAVLLEDEELGKVFLVESNDLKNKAYGFSNDKQRQAFGTAYALENGLFRYSKSNPGRGSSPYWTRTRSTTLASGVNCTKVDGRVGYIRCVVMNEGIRPAIRIKLDNGGLRTKSGDGSLASPFVLLYE